MSQVSAFIKFQPCLLDRLRDDEPEKQEESAHQRVVSFRAYQQGVYRDLEWLFNTSSHVPDPEDAYDMTHFPEVCRSVLNFGTRSLTGAFAEGLSAEEIAKSLRQSIEWFEPRIIRRTLKVQPAAEVAAGPMTINLEITGELWADPVNERLLVRTRIDLETGRCVVGDRAYGSEAAGPLH